jgi:hypothetical protein
MPRDRDDDRYDDDGEDFDRPRARRRRDDFEDDEDDRPRARRRRDEYDDDRPPPKKGLSTGVILLIVGGVLAVLAIPCVAIVIGLTLPAVQKVREAASRLKASENMKRLSIAFHHNHDTTGRLHAPFHEDPLGGPPPGSPADRLSWRVSLLPYLEQDALLRRFKATEPWNSPANQPLANTVVPDYADIETPADPATRIRLFCDNGALFDTDRTRRVGLMGVSDGTSNTIAYVESTEKVTWTQFNDFRFEPSPTSPPPPLGKPGASVFLVVMADGSVRPVRKTVTPEVLRMAITRAGGEVLPPGWEQ